MKRLFPASLAAALALPFSTVAAAVAQSESGTVRIIQTNSAGDNVHIIDPATNQVVQVIEGIPKAHGVAAAPDGGTLYVAETIPGRIWAWELPEPGVARLDRAAGTLCRGRLVAAPGGHVEFDSMAVDGAGNVCVATLHRGGITVAAPDGSSVEHVPLPDPVTTNVCFGGPDLRTAWATLSGTGQLVSFEWPRPGLRLNYT